MAFSCSKFVSRLSSRLQPSFAFKFNKNNSLSSLTSLCSPSHLPLSARRFSCLSRLPLELSCVGSLMPLHSAIASATLVSSLSSESDSWALVPQVGDR
ncbi:uncharacterized protein LOC110611748 isoform X2 [Manihot esculenta]|uniref:Uncharacterized protein n=1 Tax=Manihot esculenta TaxID=3983 RepID=A0ACB7HVW0_MANES|nr:uncharacterized protein LOC110611748 isoform X2 [Manihot esculenta]KAG8656927.1 hypothetical protein MANES_03G022800v8 [Manihot esculenta]